jgi:hypothetical protein
MTNSEQGLPPNRIGSNTKLNCSAIVNITDEDHIILLTGSEARALQCCTPDSLVEHLV